MGSQHATCVLFRQLPLGFNIAYIPKGPVIDWQDTSAVRLALNDLKQFARRKRTIFLRIEPDAPYHHSIEQHFLKTGFVIGKAIQPTTTIVIDITPSENTILAAMKSKTRYNIRLASRKGITVRMGNGADIPQFHMLSQITAERDGFAIHSLLYYQKVFGQFPSENRALLMAEYQGECLASLMVFAWHGKAYYLYGASSNAYRNKMPTYLLQWEAIKWAKSNGCHAYDLWGIPDENPETLEAEFQNRSDGLWGIYRFKRGFGGQIVQSVGAYDHVYSSVLYFLFKQLKSKT